MATLIGRGLDTTHTGIIAATDKHLLIVISTLGCAVISHENENGIILQLLLLEKATQPLEVFIDVGDHAIEPLAIIRHVFGGIKVTVFLLHIVRRVRRVRRDETQERLILVRLDKLHRLGEKHIGAIALEFLRLTIHQQRIVDIVITPVIRDLSQPPTPVIHRLLKTPVLRPVRIVIPQVPLAKQPRRIPMLLQHLR